MAVLCQHFHDEATGTLSYIVWDESDSQAVVFDPVLNFDPVNCKVSEESLDRLVSFLKGKNLQVEAIIETHVHADHWTSAFRLKEIFPKAKVYIGARIAEVLENFRFLYDEDAPTLSDHFDVFVKDGDSIEVGSLKFSVLETPGHTPCCSSFYGHGLVFVGDALFMPDAGTGRCDFPGGDATTLYQSITEKIFTLPAETKILTGHDYQPGGRELQFSATVGDHLINNIRINSKINESEFVQARRERDKQLNLPKLLFPSLQINLRSGRLLPPDPEGRRYLKIPYWVVEKQGT